MENAAFQSPSQIMTGIAPQELLALQQDLHTYVSNTRATTATPRRFVLVLKNLQRKPVINFDTPLILPSELFFKAVPFIQKLHYQHSLSCPESAARMPRRSMTAVIATTMGVGMLVRGRGGGVR